MAMQQRLRAVLDARRASRLCWRCALNSPRCNSTSAAGVLDSSKSTGGVSYGPELQQEIVSEADLPLRDFRIRVMAAGRPVTLPAGRPLLTKFHKTPNTEPASRSLRETQSELSQIDKKPRIRIMHNGQPISLSNTSQSQSKRTAKRPSTRHVSVLKFRKFMRRDTIPQEVLSNLPHIRLNEPESKSSDEKPRIRKTNNGQPVSLSNTLQSQSLSTVQKPPIQYQPAPLSFRKYLGNRGKKVRDAVPKVVYNLPHTRRVVAATASRSLNKPESELRQPRSKAGGSIRVMTKEQSVTLNTMLQAIRGRLRRDQVKALGWILKKVSVNSKSKSDRATRFSRPRIYKVGTAPARATRFSKPRIHKVGTDPTRATRFSKPRIHKVGTDPTQANVPYNRFRTEKDATTRLVHKVGRLLAERPTDASGAPLEGQHEDDDFQDTLTSLLDSFRKLHPASLPDSNRKIGKSTSRIRRSRDRSNRRVSTSNMRFSPRDRLIRRVAPSERLTFNHRSLASPRRLFSTTTHRDENRYYATATVSKRKLRLALHTLNTSAESDCAG